jgi:hypothetical protein
MRKPEFLTLGKKSELTFDNGYEQYIVMANRKESIENQLSKHNTPNVYKTALKVELKKVNDWLEENECLRP